MFKLIKKIKSNNKGETLAIVLIGIVLLAMLGTVILSVTSVNFRMKLTVLQSKKNFYYCERAMDDIYAGIGVDVSTAIEVGYKEAIKNVVSKTVSPSGGSTYNLSNSDDSTAIFKNKYYELIKAKYGKNTPADIVALKTILYGYIATSTDATMTVENIGDVIVDDTAKKITIKDLKVKSVTSKGYAANIKTDLIINTPPVKLSFFDTFELNYSALFNCAIIANGNKIVNTSNATNWNKHASITITNSGKVDIDGNIYAGSNFDYQNNKYVQDTISDSSIDPTTGDRTVTVADSTFRKNSIDLGGANVDITASSVVAAGSINTGSYVGGTSPNNGSSTEVGNTKLSFMPKDSTTNAGKLFLWAKNIEVNGNNDNVDVDGDCGILDDLELNGSNNIVNIKGSYYGYGFDGDVDTVTEADSNENAQYGKPTTGLYEHEKRSAVIINGKEADLQLTGSNKELMLAGRSYIDITGKGAADSNSANYMTGESISFRGNQQVYMAGENELGDKIKSNPIAASEILTYITPTGLDFSGLGLDPSKFIAKRFEDSIYFYHNAVNPVAQTQYINTQYGFLAERTKIKDTIKTGMKIKNVKIGAAEKDINTVGTVMQVNNYDVSTPGSTLNYGVKNKTRFVDLIKDLKYRYKALSFSMDDDRDKALGDEYSSTSVDPPVTTPYESYITFSNISIGDEQKEVQNILTMSPAQRTANGIDEFTAKDIADLANIGITSSTNIGYIVFDNRVARGNAGGEIKDIPASVNCGVIITSGNLRLDHDFRGLIICGGDLIIDSSKNVKIQSDPALVKILVNRCEILRKLLGFSSSSGGSGVESDVKNYTYRDLISYDNWKKNAE